MSSVFINKPMFEKRTDDALLTGMAFFAGFYHGFTSAKAMTKPLPKNVKDKMYQAIEKTYTDAHNQYGELSNPAKTYIKNTLNENEVGVTDEGINYLWDGYIEALNSK